MEQSDKPSFQTNNRRTTYTVYSGSVNDSSPYLFIKIPMKYLMKLVTMWCDRQNVWWRDWIITLYKLTSLFHQDGKGSVSWSLNIINVNIKINISIVITRASGHETSHISEAEICEFRVHSNIYPIGTFFEEIWKFLFCWLVIFLILLIPKLYYIWGSRTNAHNQQQSW